MSKQARAPTPLVLRSSPSLNLKIRELFKPIDRLTTGFSRAISLTVTELFMTLFVPLAAAAIDRRFARRIMLLFSLNLYVVNALKNALQLPRPRSADGSGAGLSHEEMGYGFPSLHSAESLALPMFAVSASSYPPLAAALSSGVAGYLMSAWPGLVGFARLHLGVHSLPDVLGGWLLGYALSRQFERAVASGGLEGLLTSSLLPPLVLPFAVTMALLHPRPPVAEAAAHASSGKKADTSVTESAIVLGCAAGTAIAMWRDANYPHAQLPPLPMVAAAQGAGGVLIKFLTAVLLTGGSKAFLKPAARALVDGVASALGGRVATELAPPGGAVRDCYARVLCYTGLGYVVLDVVPMLCGN